MNADQKGVGGETNLEFLLLASQVRLGPVAHSIDGKTSLKWLNCRKKLCSKELTELQVQCRKEMWPKALLHVAQWPRTNFLQSSSNNIGKQSTKNNKKFGVASSPKVACQARHVSHTPYK